MCRNRSDLTRRCLLHRWILPLIAVVVAVVLAATAASSGREAAVAGVARFETHGLDSCQAPTHAQMQDMYQGTAWTWWGVYIGGPDRACSNQNLTRAWIARETQTRRHWGLLPIWVGPQAPCWNPGAVRMSYGVTTARSQGALAGRGAYRRAASLGLTPSTPVVLDVEGFDTGNARCLAAVRSFVAGWSAALTKRHLVAGVYGSACASGLRQLWTVSPRPQFVWAASWNNENDVYDTSCLSRSVWPVRHKQYLGAITRSANGTSLSVDVSCAQGPMFAIVRRHDPTACTR